MFIQLKTLGWTIDPNSRSVWLVGDTTGPLLTNSTLGLSFHTTNHKYVTLLTFLEFSKTTKAFAAAGLCWRKPFHYLLETKVMMEIFWKWWILDTSRTGKMVKYVVKCLNPVCTVLCVLCHAEFYPSLCKLFSSPSRFYMIFFGVCSARQNTHSSFILQTFFFFFNLTSAQNIESQYLVILR